MVILALMSGSSLDGVDIGLIDISGNRTYEIISADTIPYSSFWLEELPSIGSSSAIQFFELEALYSTYISELILKYIKSSTSKIDCISFHGHSVTHQVDQGFSLQLGNGGIIASKTGIQTLVDFRTGDMAKGGQGAPLMAIVDRDFFPGYSAAINLGGICNIAGSYLDKSVAYDIGPCNQLLNAAAAYRNLQMDVDSELAKAGQVQESLLSYFQRDSYLKKSWPKSMDNQQLRDYYLKIELFEKYSPEDFAKTACAFIADLIADELAELKNLKCLDPHVSKVLFTGGGCHHQVLWDHIVNVCSRKNIFAFKPRPQVIDYKELLLMAYLAYLRINNKHNILSEYTGASSHTLGGAIYGP